MSTFVRNVLGEQRKRAVASILSYAEGNIYPQLTERQQRDLRAKVIAAIAQYHDTCLDMLKASVDDGTAVNQEALRLLVKINRDVTAMRESDG